MKGCCNYGYIYIKKGHLVMEDKLTFKQTILLSEKLKEEVDVKVKSEDLTIGRYIRSLIKNDLNKKEPEPEPEIIN